MAALACDFRVMGSGFKMGLTETKVASEFQLSTCA